MQVLKNKIIYVCGDSHSAGGELADDILWPDLHPGLYREHEQRDQSKLFAWRDARHKKLSQGNPVTYQEYYELCHQHAWPALLSQSQKITTINSSVQGASMEWITRQSITDICQMISTNSQLDITVILQPSYWGRLQYFEPSSKHFENLQLSDPSGMDSRIHRWLITHETDYSLITRWLLSLAGAITTLANFRCEVLLLDSGFLTNMDELIASSGLITLYEQLIKPRWLGKGMNEISKHVDYARCPDHHYSRQVHVEIAEEIARILA